MFQGRIAQNRRWPARTSHRHRSQRRSGGEAPGSDSGSITLQHLIALYPGCVHDGHRLDAGARAPEGCYGLLVEAIPTHRPSFRGSSDAVFTARARKIKWFWRKSAARTLRSAGAGGDRQRRGIGSAEPQAAGNPAPRAECPHGRSGSAIHRQAGERGAVTIVHQHGRPGYGHSARRRSGGARRLYVIGTNRHESRRIDNHWRPRRTAG